MKICYIISTCDKYIETRVKYQLEHMFKNVNKEDIYFLTSKPNIEERQFGWYTMDDTQNITWKYIYFIYNMDILHYDWYVFIDDDTFIFKNRIENLLNNYNSKESYYIGNELDHIKEQFCLYMSGGAGYVISNGLYRHIYNFLKKIGMNEAYYYILNLKDQFCDDLCIGLWINEIKKEHAIHQINSNLFHVGLHKSEQELESAITFHKVTTEEQHIFYSLVTDKNNTNETIFTLVTDFKYYDKAKRTIIDLRTKGNWNGEIVLITIDFNLNTNFKDFYNIIEKKFPQIYKIELLNKIGESGFTDTTDKREINKLNQWEKLHVFDNYFTKWNRVVFLDAGLRILDDVKYLLEQDYKDRLLAPKDGKLYDNNTFSCQISYDNPCLIDSFKGEFGEEVLKSNYMLNCIWIYDTNILKVCDKNQLIEAMNKYTFCKTNEMGIMNILFHFKYNLWERMSIKASNGKFLFDWCELNNPDTNWQDYCCIKYPVTITFDDC